MVFVQQDTIPRGSNPRTSRRRKGLDGRGGGRNPGVISLSVAIVNPVARRVLLPPVLLYLLAGVIAGPSVFGVFDPADLHEIFEPISLRG